MRLSTRDYCSSGEFLFTHNFVRLWSLSALGFFTIWVSSGVAELYCVEGGSRPPTLGNIFYLWYCHIFLSVSILYSPYYLQRRSFGAFVSRNTTNQWDQPVGGITSSWRRRSGYPPVKFDWRPFLLRYIVIEHTEVAILDYGLRTCTKGNHIDYNHQLQL